MTIKIVCPVCKANNELTPQVQACRRCREDLSLLYSVKGYSYKYRLLAVKLLAQRHLKEGVNATKFAQSFDKSL